MAIISFEKLAGDGGFTAIPDSFCKLNWHQGPEGEAGTQYLFAVDDEYLEKAYATSGRVGYSNAVHSAEAAAMSKGGNPGSFKSPDSDDDFDFNSGYFAAFTTSNLTVKVVSFDDGERVARKVFLLDADQKFVKFGHKFDDIDEVTITPVSATDSDPTDSWDTNGNLSISRTFVMDDLFIDF